MKLKKKLKQFFCKCTLVEDLYPNNEGKFRIAFCINCGKLFIIDIEKNKLFLPEEHHKVYIVNKEANKNGK